MAGSISLSLSQQFDELGRPLSDGQLLIYASTTTTPQLAYQDSGLTNAHPWPIPLDSAGRIPQLYFADGFIRIWLKDRYGVTQREADGVMVIGPSSGSGGGGSVDPTKILGTGDLKFRHGTGILSGFVRCNGRSIGSASSAATERANADTEALFLYLWDDVSLPVSGGRGGSAAADWAANKNIQAPDYRSRALAGLSDMGNSANAVFSGVTFQTGDATTLNSLVGAARRQLLASQIPLITSSNPALIPISVSSVRNDIQRSGTNDNFTSVGGAGGPLRNIAQDLVASVGNIAIGTTNVNSNNTGGLAFDAVSPFVLITFYIKL
jgi:hypothetical protein